MINQSTPAGLPNGPSAAVAQEGPGHGHASLGRERRLRLWPTLVIGLLSTGCTPELQERVVAPKLAEAPGMVASPQVGRLSQLVSPKAYALDFTIDPSQKEFSAQATLTVVLKQRTKAFYVHARELSDLQGQLVSGANNRVTLSVEAESLLRIEFDTPLDAGEHSIEIRYKGLFTPDLAGLYRVKAGGLDYAFTQFEALDARRAFPCFDEPGFKARFTVSVTTAKENLVIANTRQLSDTAAGALQHTVRFAQTEPLPTYLVALAVGPFDLRETVIPANELRKTPIPLRGVAVRGKGANLEYAMKVSGPIVEELERYFGIPYPFDKLDLLAVPDFGAGAMENAGAVTFREQLLLLDAATATEAQRRAIFDVAAHEFAHQWFGNLVTMQWWDDLWLNEAFATWLGEKTVRRLNPGWETDLEFQGYTQSAMDADSLVSARVIRQPIQTEGDIGSAFDSLTYSKGGALIAMFERYTGEASFREGIGRYMKSYRFGNATTEQFLRSALFSQPTEVVDSFKQFLDRPGVPSVQLTKKCTGDKLDAVTVQVSRFLPLGSAGNSKSAWTFPLCVKTSDGRFCELVATKGEPMTITPKKPMKCPSFMLPNDGGEFYVRMAPSKGDVDNLLAAARQLSPRERLVLVDAVRSGFRSGSLGLEDSVAALLALANDPVDAVRFGGVDVLSFVAEMLEGSQRQSFEQKVATAYKPVWSKLGWERKEGDKAGNPEKDSLTRAQALFFMTQLARDPSLRKTATAKATAMLRSKEKLSLKGLDPELLEMVLTVGVEDGDLFDDAVAQLKLTDDPIVRRALILALGRAPGKTAAEKRVRLLLSDQLRANELGRLAFSGFESRRTARTSWEALRPRLAEVSAKLPEGARDRLAGIGAQLCETTFEAELRTAFEPMLEKIQGGKLAFDNALEANRICSAISNHHQSKAKSQSR